MKKRNETFTIIFLIVFLLYNVFFWVIPLKNMHLLGLSTDSR